MKKTCIILALLLTLTGCGSLQTFETLGSVPQQSPEQPVKRPVSVELPQEAAENAWYGEEDTMYVCDNYTISLRTYRSGDLTSTVQSLSGYKPEQLTLMESSIGNVDRYDWVWTAAGDTGDLVCRAAILDDGDYHYCLCVMAEAAVCGELAGEWNALFSSFCMEK